MICTSPTTTSSAVLACPRALTGLRGLARGSQVQGSSQSHPPSIFGKMQVTRGKRFLPLSGYKNRYRSAYATDSFTAASGRPTITIEMSTTRQKGFRLILLPIGYFGLVQLQPSSENALFRFCLEERNSFLLGFDRFLELARLGVGGSQCI